jgi:hypothetical protein
MTCSCAPGRCECVRTLRDRTIMTWSGASRWLGIRTLPKHQHTPTASGKSSRGRAPRRPPRLRRLARCSIRCSIQNKHTAGVVHIQGSLTPGPDSELGHPLSHIAPLGLGESSHPLSPQLNQYIDTHSHTQPQSHLRACDKHILSLRVYARARPGHAPPVPAHLRSISPHRFHHRRTPRAQPCPASTREKGRTVNNVLAPPRSLT